MESSADSEAGLRAQVVAMMRYATRAACATCATTFVKERYQATSSGMQGRRPQHGLSFCDQLAWFVLIPD